MCLSVYFLKQTNKQINKPNGPHKRKKVKGFIRGGSGYYKKTTSKQEAY